jgi:hypothetical protein
MSQPSLFLLRPFLQIFTRLATRSRLLTLLQDLSFNGFSLLALKIDFKVGEWDKKSMFAGVPGIRQQYLLFVGGSETQSIVL